MPNTLIVSKKLYSFYKNNVLDLLSEMNSAIRKKADSLEEEKASFVRELYTVHTIYLDQVQSSIDNIEYGEYTVADLLHLSSTVYLSNLKLRWLLEIQTRDFQNLIDSSEIEIRKNLEKANISFYEGKKEDTLKLLLALVQKVPDNYPVLMTTGCYYLNEFNKPDLAAKFFKKAVKSANDLESDHFKILAVHHLVSAHVLLDEKEKALDLLQKLELKGRISGPLYYSMAQIFGLMKKDDEALKYFELALKWHPIYFSRALLDPSFDNLHDKLCVRLHEYDNKFRTYGSEFREKMNRLIEIADIYELTEFRPSLEKQLALIEKQINRINVDCFTGYRTGIVRYFQGTFPEALHELGNAVIRKHAVSLRGLRKKQELADKRSGLPYFLYMPLLGISTAASIYYIQKPVIESFNLSFPLSDFILPVVLPFSFAFLVMFLFTRVLKLLRMPNKKELELIRNMGKVEKELRKIEDDLSKFWDTKISRYVEVAAIWR